MLCCRRCAMRTLGRNLRVSYFAYGISVLAALLAVVPIPLVKAAPAPPTYAITTARVSRRAGPPLENATVLIRDGKIAAVGTSVEVPKDAQVINAKGLEVYPGLFDSVTQMGLSEIAAVASTVDSSEIGLYNPDVVAATAVLPSSAHIPVTRADGITHVIAAPGSGGFDFFRSASGIGGQASTLPLFCWTIDEMLIRKSAAMGLCRAQMPTPSL